MRKTNYILFSIILVVIVMSCRKSVAPSYNLNLTLALPQGYTAALPSGIEIKIQNTQTDREIIVHTNSSGGITESLVEGNYNVKCSFTITSDGVDYFFNGTLSNYLLTKEATLKMDLVLAKNTGGFVFKEIYFAGSKTPDGKNYYSDQFHEIYNNSNDTLYADKLCIGILQQSGTTPNVWVNSNGTMMDDLPVTSQIWTVPGTGKDYPVYPGKSIIIAQDGINHKTDPNGNPASPVDLSKADFETYMEIAGKDTDSPGVPNLILIYTTSTTAVDWLHNVGGAAVIIFRLPVDWQTYVANPANFKTAPGSTSTTKYLMVNKSLVVDGVEILSNDETKRYKRLPSTIDAGFTYLDAGSYSSLSVRRKAKMIIGGRVIYKDTNNSTVDFLHDLKPTPGVNPTVIEN